MPEESPPIAPPGAPPFVPGITDPKFAPDVVDSNIPTESTPAPPPIVEGITDPRFVDPKKEKQIVSGGENGIDRDEVVWNAKGGAVVLDNTTGSEAVRISQKGGGNVKITDTVNSEFAPNNHQLLVNGDKFSTTKGDYFNQIQGNSEVRPFGDHTITVGNPSFFTTSLAQDWLDTFQDIAIAKTNPELNYGGVGVILKLHFLLMAHLARVVR